MRGGSAVALRLKRLLDERGVHLEEAARATGLSRSLIHGVMWQHVPMSARFRQKMGEYVAGFGGDGEWWMSEGRTEIMLQQDALRHWGLNRDPFVNEIRDPIEDCFLTQEAKWVERNVMDAIKAKAFFAIVGATGCGKTTLMDRIVARGARSGRMAVAQPRLCDTESLHAGAIYDAVIWDLGQMKPPLSREARARKMLEVLIAKRDVADAVLIVEEAHRLHHTTLRALKSFYDEKLNGQRLLSICLVGQPPLKARMDGADMLEVRNRCQVWELKKFTKVDLRSYLAVKLGKVGLELEKAFEADAVDAMSVRALSPLEANVLTSAAMTVAWEQGVKRVSKEIVNEC